MNTIVLDGVNESIYYEKLKNGLDVYLMPINRVSSFAITLNVKFGSAITNFKDNKSEKNIKLPNGTAHFLEHLMFKMEDGSDASEKFSLLGSDANAFTSYYQTAYTVNSSDNFKDNLDLLLEYVFNPYFTNENVNEEKGIIKSETNMSDDNIDSKMMNSLNSNLFIRENIKYKICGDVEDVEKISLEDIETAYNYFYYSENMFIVITGNFNPEEALAIIEEKMNEKEFREIPDITVKKVREPMQVEKEKISIKGDSKKMILGIKIPSPIKDMNSIELFNYINLIFSINFGRTSEFQNKLLTGNIINRPLSMQLYNVENYYVLYLYVDSDYPDRFITLLKKKIDSLSVSKEELIRKVRVLKSDYLLSTDDIDAMNSIIQLDIIKYGEINNKMFSLFDELNIETIKKIIKKINLKNMVVVKHKKVSVDK